MTQQPFPATSLRGAVDLSALKRPAQVAGSAGAPGAPGAPGSPGAAGPGDLSGVVAAGTDATIRDVIAASSHHPVLMVVWSARLRESADFVAVLETVVRRYNGRLQLVAVNADTNPTILQAFQVRAVPVSFALLQGQPVPLFEGAQPEAQVTAVIDQVLALATQHGVTGTVDAGDAAVADLADEPTEPTEPPLPPLHQQAFDAIEADDLDGAASAYREALTQNPADVDAKLGLAQVGLLQRTRDIDPQAARAAAAEAPTDVDAQILVADIDLLGGHIEDAFTRLVATVRVTSDADRNRAREHLVELFEVVGTTDDRVVRARRMLMSILY